MPRNRAAADEDIVRKGSMIAPLLLLGLVVLIFFANGIRWETVFSPRISVSDFEDFRGFVSDLERDFKEKSDPYKQLLVSKFLEPVLHADKEKWEVIRTSKSRRAQAFLADKLNEVLDKPDLKEDLKDLVANCPGIKEMAWGPVDENRKLLECAYPGQLKPYRETLFGEDIQKLFKIPHDIVTGVPFFIQSQIVAVSVLALLSLLPGFAGLIYRRAFWVWFLAAFAVLFLVNSWFASIDWDYFGKRQADQLEIPYGFYLWVEVLSIQLLIAFRLRRHSSVTVDARTKRNGIILAAILILLAGGSSFWVFYHLKVISTKEVPAEQQIWFSLLLIGGVLIVLQIAYALFSQSLRSGNSEVKLGKNIVVCLDGTWNEPGTTEYGHVAETNVLKLFKLLKGELKQGKRYKQYNTSQCKEYPDSKKIEANAQPVKQIAFYYRGVGNTMENSEFGQVLGGAFGMGAIAIVERAYLDVAKVYQQGDRIFIFGFSRGAAIARLLAGVIGHRSIPTSMWTLRCFGRSIALWTSARKIEDIQSPVMVDVLGCWDTVGSFGISKNIFGIPFQQMNLLKDLTVSLCVKRAYHMVALDETRDAFVPTLMEPDPTDSKRITEVWFSGSHGNVGGGYATDQLSDVTLDFLLRHVSSSYPDRPEDESWGLYLNAVAKSEGVNSGMVAMHPDLKGPIRHATGAVYSYAPRRVPVHAVINDSVFERMRDTFPVYAPQSLFDLNNELVTEREKVKVEVTKLMETGSLNEEECKEIVDWSEKKLSLMKWSNLDLSERPNPAKELGNAFPQEAVAPAA
jgi:uncharacterized protein (DUF2235 family)